MLDKSFSLRSNSSIVRLPGIVETSCSSLLRVSIKVTGVPVAWRSLTALGGMCGTRGNFEVKPTTNLSSSFLRLAASADELMVVCFLTEVAAIG